MALTEKWAAERLQDNAASPFPGYDPPFKLFGRKNEVVVEVLP